MSAKKQASVIEYEYSEKRNPKRALLIEVAINESLLVVKHLEEVYFVHIIGEKLGGGHKLGYYVTPSAVPLPETKESYKVIKKIDVDGEIVEGALLLAKNQAWFSQARRYFDKLRWLDK
ncbi:MAG: hypothetical protein Q8R34_00705 [bacterium]|nr:hypothetical protein [bacterium]